MANRKILLLETAPKFRAEGGMFFVDFGIPDMPLFALSPCVMLKAIGKARREYLAWSEGGKAVLVSSD